MDKIMNQNNRKLNCCICNKEYKTKGGLYLHVIKFHKLSMKEYWNVYYSKINKDDKKEYLKIVCQICGERHTSFVAIVNHVSQTHNISSKDYYDKYFKKEKEEYCKECNKDTRYVNINLGYEEFCSHKCVHNNKEVKQKTINTNLERYGTENPLGNKDIQEKKEKTNIERYGFKTPLQNKEIRNKSIQTMLDKYEVEFPIQNKTIKEKTKNTNLERYGYVVPFSQGIIKEKIKKDWLIKYGTEYPIQNKDIQEKRDKTNLERYGYENPLKNDMVKQKSRKTFQEKYGANNYISSQEYRDICEKEGSMVPLDQLSEYQLYRRSVLFETRRHKKELFKTWDGTDYYTGDILFSNKEFKVLYPEKSIYENKLMPSIDHKLSVIYCFKNNISIKDCGKLENLCICSISNNISKRHHIESEFIEYLKENKKVA